MYLVWTACYRQLVRLRPILYQIYLPIASLYALMVLLCFVTGTPVSYFVDDPLEASQQPFYIGLFSQLGAILWAATSALCLFSATLLWQQSTQQRWSWFLGAGGLVTIVLLLDDLFLLHEEFFPEYLSIPQTVVQISYGSMLIVFLVCFRNYFKETDFLLLFLALSSFGLSFILDLFSADFEGHKTIEEGFKWSGIDSWTIYFVRVCFQQLKSALRYPT